MTMNKFKFDPELQSTFGRQVRLCRRNAGLSQDVTSERCGIYRTYLSRIEAGKANPSFAVIAAIAGALNVPLYKLFLTWKD